MSYQIWLENYTQQPHIKMGSEQTCTVFCFFFSEVMDTLEYDYMNARCRLHPSATDEHRSSGAAPSSHAHFHVSSSPSEGTRRERATGSVCEVNSIRPPFLKSLQRPVSWTAHFNVSVSGLGKKAWSGLFTRHTLSCNPPTPSTSTTKLSVVRPPHTPNETLHAYVAPLSRCCI